MNILENKWRIILSAMHIFFDLFLIFSHKEDPGVLQGLPLRQLSSTSNLYVAFSP
jgi:hypothetical protein